jgi:hypothetical protein
MNNEPWIPNVPTAVRPQPSFVDRHLGFLVRVVAIGLLVMIVKPWSFGASGDTATAPTPPPPSPTPAITPQPHVGFEDFAYDPNIFGSREPTARWDLWPAAYLVTYGFVLQLGGPSPTAVPVPVGSLPPVTLPSPEASPSAPADGGPAWPASVTVPAGYHVFVVGIDMPAGYLLETAQLVRSPFAPGVNDETVALTFPASPWPDHFAVLGIPAVTGTDRLQTWTPGVYRLDLAFELTGTVTVPGTGHVLRSIQIVIETPPTFGGTDGSQPASP